MRYKKRLSSAAVIAASYVLIAGCITVEGGIPQIPDEPSVLKGPSEYRIGSGDDLSVKLFYNSELNEDVIVRPDGRISLQLLGDVDAAGRTPQELSASLRESYAAVISQPDVVVIVRESGSHRAYVGGEVTTPRMLLLDGKTTVADAVVAAGGAKSTAAIESVILVRVGPEGREAYRVDLQKAFRAGAPIPVLRAYDLVYVPKSFIAKVGDFVDLYINRIVPRNASFNAVYRIDDAPGASGFVP
jgi:protein involved in polysaccharide export with SLBB domain